MKGWFREPTKHALASCGIKTTSRSINRIDFDDFKDISQISINSSHVEGINFADWGRGDDKMAIGFFLEPYDGSVKRKNQSTIYVHNRDGEMYINGELRFPYSKDDEDLEDRNGLAENELESGRYNTKSWVIPHSLPSLTKSDADDYWSSHLHFSKRTSPDYLIEDLEYISRAIDDYYRGEN